jgi:hypothetical protein
MCGVYRLAENLLASREGLCFSELGKWLSAMFVCYRAVYHRNRGQILQWGMKPILVLADRRCNNLRLQERSLIVTDHTKNKKEGYRMVHTMRRYCLLKHVTEGRIGEWTGVTGRQGRRRQQLLDDLKGGKRGYWKLR